MAENTVARTGFDYGGMFAGAFRTWLHRFAALSLVFIALAVLQYFLGSFIKLRMAQWYCWAFGIEIVKCIQHKTLMLPLRIISSFFSYYLMLYAVTVTARYLIIGLTAEDWSLVRTIKNAGHLLSMDRVILLTALVIADITFSFLTPLLPRPTFDKWVILAMSILISIPSAAVMAAMIVYGISLAAIRDNTWEWKIRDLVVVLIILLSFDIFSHIGILLPRGLREMIHWGIKSGGLLS